jgi:hypothetical protein
MDAPTPHPTPASPPASPFPNHLPLSIVATALGACLCCGIGAVPGIAGIAFGIQVDKCFAAGDPLGARKASEHAQICGWLGVGLAGIGLVLFVLDVLLGGALE